MPSSVQSRSETRSAPVVFHVQGARVETVDQEVQCTILTHCNKRITLAFSPGFAATTGRDLTQRAGKLSTRTVRREIG